jgi:UV DNA damage endonuclease
MTLGRKIRSLRLATLQTQGLPYWQALVNENLDLLVETLRWNQAHQIQVFRISSDLVPLGSHEEVDLKALTILRAPEIATLTQGMRISFHPGQYTLLSATGTVWQSSYRDLCYHAFVLDQLGIAEGDLILHGGGVYRDRTATTDRIIEHIYSLPASIRDRLRLENDERSWSIHDLLPICETTRTPLVVDNLHHQLNGTARWKDLPWERILATWQGRRPKLHYAEQDPVKRAGAHSEYLHADAFQAFSAEVPFEDFDVMLECKAKDLALLKLREDLKNISE